MRTLHMGARAFIPVAIAGAVLFSLAPSTPAAAAEPTTTEAAQIIHIARTKLGHHWRYGATGPTYFDCSGLVRYAYKKAGDGNVIKAGSLASARSIYRYFKAQGKASRTNPKVGDLVIWGGGTHIGIYIGHGKAISTLTSGVRIHGVRAVTAPFTAYLHTGMSGKTTSAAKASTLDHDERGHLDPPDPTRGQPAAWSRGGASAHPDPRQRRSPGRPGTPGRLARAYVVSRPRRRPHRLGRGLADPLTDSDFLR